MNDSLSGRLAAFDQCGQSIRRGGHRGLCYEPWAGARRKFALCPGMAGRPCSSAYEDGNRLRTLAHALDDFATLCLGTLARQSGR